eukprot:5687092-Amphidinium_carterae.2
MLLRMALLAPSLDRLTKCCATAPVHDASMGCRPKYCLGKQPQQQPFWVCTKHVLACLPPPFTASCTQSLQASTRSCEWRLAMHCSASNSSECIIAAYGQGPIALAKCLLQAPCPASASGTTWDKEVSDQLDYTHNLVLSVAVL